MTKEEARAALAEMPAGERNKRSILHEIQYEQAPGIHTYHECPCGRSWKRGDRCAKCWAEIAEVVRK